MLVKIGQECSWNVYTVVIRRCPSGILSADKCRELKTGSECASDYEFPERAPFMVADRGVFGFSCRYALYCVRDASAVLQRVMVENSARTKITPQCHVLSTPLCQECHPVPAVSES
jgi:hypothetical protein